MGAGCCRVRVLPGPGYPGPHPGPRPAWAPAWGGVGPDPSIASLRPGDKFHFNREPFIRQHLVVAEKALSPNGEHNLAFAGSDGGGLAVRPALPALPAPVPPPRKKRRARLAGQAPLPPSRSRGGGGQARERARARDAAAALAAANGARADGEATVEQDEGEFGELNPNDSILSPAHTMELLKRMAKVEARLGRPTAAPGVPGVALRARSVDSLDALDQRGRSLPASTHETHSTTHLDGPRSLDLDLQKEGVVGVASFTLQSWHQRRPWSPPLSNSAVLLSPRQWRPVDSPTGVEKAEAPAPAGQSPSPPETPRPASPDRRDPAPADLTTASSQQTASTKALSEFIKDTYDDRLEAVRADAPETPIAPPAPSLPEVRLPDAADSDELGIATSDCLRDEAPTRVSEPPDVVKPSSKQTYYLDVASTDRRPSSSTSMASSTTESLGELEDDILHMLSSTDPEADVQQDETRVEDAGQQPRPNSQQATQPPHQFMVGESVPVSS